MLTTAEAAALLAERGIRVRGHTPTARTVEAWCKRGLIKADRVGGPRRGIYLIDESDLGSFEPPKLGRSASPRIDRLADAEQQRQQRRAHEEED